MSLTFLILTILSMAAVIVILVSALSGTYRRLMDTREKLIGTRQDLLRQFREAEYFRVASENARDGIVIMTLDGVVRWCNSAYLSIMKRKREEVIGKNPLSFALPKEDTPPKEVVDAFRYNPSDPAYKTVEVIRNRRGDGSLFWVQLSVSFRKTAQEAEYAIIVARDVTEEIEREQELKNAHGRLEIQAKEDELTGLMNRRAFMDRAAVILSGADQDGKVGFMHLDLDRFKEVNDTHGHAAGDATLVHVADILRAETPPGAWLSRFGGDEFFVMVPDCDGLDALKALADRIIERVSKVFHWSDRLLRVGASAGVALGVPGSSEPSQMLAETDFALYEAKRTGRGNALKFDAAMKGQKTFLDQRADELIYAIDTDAMDHHFQPIVDPRDHSVRGVETLVRWSHPEAGLIPPDEFLPLAIDLSLMGDLDLTSMSKALQQKKLLNRAGFADMSVSFNASPQLLHHSDFLPTLVRAVEIGQLDRSHITIEVLETTVFGNPNEAETSAAAVRDLANAGFNIHLDDFGTGYAGLSHLASLAVNGIKIDKSLIKNIFTHEASAKIVQKMVELGRDLNMSVTAEGVEDEKTALWLAEAGCTALQGYWISKPLPPGALHTWLEDSRRAPAPLKLAAR